MFKTSNSTTKNKYGNIRVTDDAYDSNFMFSTQSKKNLDWLIYFEFD